MTIPEPTPAWSDPKSPPPPPTVPPQYPAPQDPAPQYPAFQDPAFQDPAPLSATPREPAPPAFSVGPASVPASPPFSPPDPGYDPFAYGTPGYGTPGAPGYPASAVAAPTYGGYGGYGGQPGYGAQPTYYPGYAPPAKTNGLAIASLVISIVGAVSLFCYGVGGPVGAVGAILGHVARRQIRERQESGGGLALAGIITGWISTGLGLMVIALVVIFIVLAANSDPSLSGAFQNT